VPDEASVTGAGRPGAEPKGPDGEAVLRYIERFTSLLMSLGVPPMPARVFAALLITDSGRLTAAELAGTLRVSRAAISDGVRYLTRLGLVDREREPGSRRDYYRMPDDVWVKMIRLRDQTLVRWSNLLREGIDLIGAGTPAGSRMAGHAAYVEFVSRELPGVLQRWEEYQAGLPADGP
jgi:predicted transcriptional regulator